MTSGRLEPPRATRRRAELRVRRRLRVSSAARAPRESSERRGHIEIAEHLGVDASGGLPVSHVQEIGDGAPVPEDASDSSRLRARPRFENARYLARLDEAVGLGTRLGNGNALLLGLGPIVVRCGVDRQRDEIFILARRRLVVRTSHDQSLPCLTEIATDGTPLRVAFIPLSHRQFKRAVVMTESSTTLSGSTRMCPSEVEGESFAALRARFRGAFLGCLVGDAIGRPFEMMSARDGRLGPALRDMLTSRRPWRYTDDGEMMISVAESLVRMGGFSASDLLSSLASNYDPARGYGHGMKLAVAAYKGGRRADTASWVEGSKGNGGAVRVVPIACAYHDDLDLLSSFAEDSAGTTHAHPLGRAGATAHAIAIAQAVGHRGDWDRVAAMKLLAELVRSRSIANSTLASKLDSVRHLIDASAASDEAGRVLGNGTLAEETVPLALFCFLRWAPDFERVVTSAVLAGGDTDTTAAMSGALCGALVGEGGIPAGWIERLEHEPKGPAHVRTLADAMFEDHSERCVRRLGVDQRSLE
jgi:poly(ADP-ribose) glycohydrolase ARH3